MSTTIVASEVKAVPPVVSSIQDIPLEKIRESKTNPRTQFDPTKLAELAENIRQHGVLQPILVRPLPKGAADTYELVAGARRYRASKLARRESIPATVRELTDAQALELQVIESSVVRKSFLCSVWRGTSFTCKRCDQILFCLQRKPISVLPKIRARLYARAASRF